MRSLVSKTPPSFHTYSHVKKGDKLVIRNSICRAVPLQDQKISDTKKHFETSTESMSSIITAAFKATIGLLVNKGRDKAAERFKEGDVTDEKFRGLVVRDIEDIKSKLDGLARRDLLASISFFKEGIELLYDVFQKARSRSERGAITAQEAAGSATSETFSLAKRVNKLELTALDESATRTLDNAKDRFKDARRKATEAFANEALVLSDRVLAMQYRVMATVLETVDNPQDALSACRVCIEELHRLPAVLKSFDVELTKGFLARLNKDERREIISTVCHVNRVIYDVTQMVACRGEIMMLPSVDTGKERVDPLRDRRIAEVLKKQGVEHCFVNPWSFGQEGEEDHKLKNPTGITTNTHGQFIIADNGDKTLKVFDSNGHFSHHFNPQTDDADTELDILDVVTDVESNIHILVKLKKPGAKGYEREVQVYNTADQLYKFPVRRGYWGRLTVSGSKVLVLSEVGVVDVYEQHGKRVCCFGKGEFKHGTDFTAANDGRVMVIDRNDSSVHLFTVEGQQLDKFNINFEENSYYLIACHPAREHVVVAGYERGADCPSLAIYTTSGEFVRRIQLDEEKYSEMIGITVTMEGHIAVLLRVQDFIWMVIVI